MRGDLRGVLVVAVDSLPFDARLLKLRLVFRNLIDENSIIDVVVATRHVCFVVSQFYTNFTIFSSFDDSSGSAPKISVKLRK